jgi:hypothetical protein
MPTGEIVVANGGTQELRVFSPTGAFVKLLGRRGRGPGEFQSLSSLTRNKDSLFATEQAPGPSQLQLFTFADGFRNNTLLRAANTPRGVTAAGRLATGDLLVRQGGFAAVTPPPLGTLQRDSATLGILTLGEPGEVSWIGTVPNNTWYSYNLAAGPVRTTLSRYTLGPSLVAVASGENVWIGDTGTGMIRVFDGAGRAVREFAAPFASRTFNEAALTRAKMQALEAASDDNVRSRVEAHYSTVIRPRTTPRFGRLIAGLAGEVWVESYEEDAGAPRQVIVLSATGRPVATLRIPSSVTVHEIGADYVVGVETDADGIQRIVQLRLQR